MYKIFPFYKVKTNSLKAINNKKGEKYENYTKWKRI